ncbi:hypothetical protein Poli38472_007694 [Pythium oligandrum]|uniref:DUF4442 domain-containing protein n=1 Tax=Pythium oligandrum TaxID=41045 RepID=A0A8K1CSM9_PYTOL|nr:hypothetical protein Poli38472_007694 [Pythium oligandrum]|eukprot:TMW68022.1 hypothetical protein Poli38472_007694 [Pythium oligandrum]
MAAKMNRLSRMVSKVTTSTLPDPLKHSALSFMFNSQVKMALTCGIHIKEWTHDQAKVELKNRWRVQNHIGGVHACGMALLAESASGMVFGMNVPDTHIPLIKSMTVRYKRVAKGDLKAVASLTPEQIKEITSSERGEVLVDVKVTDSSGEQPIECDMVWAWVAKKKKD